MARSAQVPRDPRVATSLDVAIAEGVHTLRRQHDWTQEHLASRLRELGFLSWTRSMVAALETRRRQISAEDLFCLSVALGVSPGALIETGLIWIRLGGVVVGADTIVYTLGVARD